MKIFRVILEVLSGDSNADRVVPPSGFTARLTTFSAAAMAFLIVFVLALSLAMGRLASQWTLELANTSTVRISAPEGQMVPQSEAVLEVLRTTPGIASARVISDAEQRKLLEPWFGPDLPIDNLPIPSLIEVLEEGSGPDFFGLKLRLSAEAPGAVLDDHTRWRRPLVIAATQLRILGLVSILLIMGSMAAMITLAAQSALAANGLGGHSRSQPLSWSPLCCWSANRWTGSRPGMSSPRHSWCRRHLWCWRALRPTSTVC